MRVPQVLQRAAPREAPTADPGAAEECALWARQQRGPSASMMAFFCEVIIDIIWLIWYIHSIYGIYIVYIYGICMVLTYHFLLLIWYINIWYINVY